MDRENSPLVSVIVPIYKVEPYLRDCIDSLLAQTYTNLEIILVDDGSPDGCPDICDEYASQDPRIQVIHKNNGGLSDARNCGMVTATGERIIFVDSDDLVAPGMIEALVKACPEPDAVAAVAPVRFANGDAQHATEPSEPICCTDIQKFVRHRSGMFACGILYRRSVIENLCLRFDVSLRNLEDVAWNMCYLAHTPKMYFLHGVMYHYRQNPTSITSRSADKHWQVGSWFRARSSIFSWFADRELTEKSMEVLRFANRYCFNNIIAECIVGKLTYSNYAAQRIVPTDTGVRLPEQVLENLFPRLYFYAYTGLMRLRNRLRH